MLQIVIQDHQQTRLPRPGSATGPCRQAIALSGRSLHDLPQRSKESREGRRIQRRNFELGMTLVSPVYCTHRRSSWRESEQR